MVGLIAVETQACGFSDEMGANVCFTAFTVGYALYFVAHSVTKL
jgi:hypothetical protein